MKRYNTDHLVHHPYEYIGTFDQWDIHINRRGWYVIYDGHNSYWVRVNSVFNSSFMIPEEVHAFCKAHQNLNA